MMQHKNIILFFLIISLLIIPAKNQRNPDFIFAFGSTRWGELGIGNSSTPPQTTIFKSLTNSILQNVDVENIYAGLGTTYFQTTDLKLYGFGRGNYGQLGNGKLESSNLPIPVGVPLGGLLHGKKILIIGVSSFHVVVLADDQKLYAWGSNHAGGLGDGTYIDKSSPVAVKMEAFGPEKVLDIKGGKGHSATVTKSGKVFTWGDNRYGQLGIDSYTITNKPTRVLGPLADKKIIKISCGMQRTLALTETGKLYSWGYGWLGGLGNGNGHENGRRRRPIFVTPKPIPVLLKELEKERIVDVSSGWHTLVLTDKGKVYSWGYNQYGQLCNGETKDKNKPDEIKQEGILDDDDGPTKKIKAISAGSFHSLLLTEDGKVYACGDNEFGALGDGTLIPKSVPTPVRTDGLLKNVNISEIAGGWGHSILLERTHKICFGKLHTDPLACGGKGKCLGGNNCLCNAGRRGEECEIENICFGQSHANSSLVCSGFGICLSNDTCSCNIGYIGIQCGQVANCFGIPANATNVCSGNGACKTSDHCVCNHGFTGPNCALKICTPKLVSFWSGSLKGVDKKGLNSFRVLDIDFGSPGVSGGVAFNFAKGASSLSTSVSNDKFPANEMTLTLWMKSPAAPPTSNSWQPALFTYYSQGSKTQKEIGLLNYKDLYVEKSNFRSRYSQVNLASSQWEHVALTWSGPSKEVRLYRNGQLILTETADQFRSPLLEGGSLVMGQTQNCQGGCFHQDQRFVGLMDHIYLFNKVLTQFEIQVLHRRKKFCCGKSADDPDVCEGHGTCVESDVCKCNKGFSGSHCETLNACNGLNYTSSLVCSGNGECVEPEQCKCKPGWNGRYCNTINQCFGISAFDSSVCNSRGVCQFNNVCVCNNGYGGDQCQYMSQSGFVSCTTPGCTATSALAKAFLPRGYKVNYGSLTVAVESTDFSGPLEYVEYVKVNGKPVHAACDPGVDNQCGRFYTCFSGLNILPSLNAGNGGFQIEMKITPEVNYFRCENKLLNARFDLVYNTTETTCFGIKGTSASTCSGFGDCVNDDVCKCINGYEGKTCGTQIHCKNIPSTDPKVCSGRGVCYSLEKCRCNAGYGSSNCQDFVCSGKVSSERSVCSGHGRCAGPEKCICNEGFKSKKDCSVPDRKNNTLAFEKSDSLSCQTKGCTGTKIVKFGNENKKLRKAIIAVEVEQTDFYGADKYIEWIKVDGREIHGKCDPGVSSCGSYYACIRNYTLIRPIEQGNTGYSVQIKLSPAVTQQCGGKALNARIITSFDLEPAPTNPISIIDTVFIILASIAAIVFVLVLVILLIAYVIWRMRRIDKGKEGRDGLIINGEETISEDVLNARSITEVPKEEEEIIMKVFDDMLN